MESRTATDTRRFVLVTGLSGAGKSQALKVLEDLGYYCVDNLPTSLVAPFAEAIAGSTARYRRIAVCVDARAGHDVENLPGVLDQIADAGTAVETLFLECSNDVLMRRYSESRRRHPAAPGESVEAGIRREREMLAPIRARADVIVDTSAVSLPDLRERIAGTFAGVRDDTRMVITVVSFGFKHGIPAEADLVFDVRFLPNPHYVTELRPFTGETPAVRDYVIDNDIAREFMARLNGLLGFLIPRYVDEGKAYLTIGVGCTGGQHRSVTVANAIAEFLRTLGFEGRVRHRDAKGFGQASGPVDGNRS